MSRKKYRSKRDVEYIQGTLILLGILCVLVIIYIQTSGHTFEVWLWITFIRFLYLMIILTVCFFLSAYIVLKHARFSEDTPREKIEAVIIFTLLFTVCASIAVYIFKYFVLTKVFSIPSPLQLVADSSLLVITFFCVLILPLICGVYIFSAYEFHSLGVKRIVFKRTFRLPYFLRRLTWFFEILSFLLFGDRYLVLQAVEITRLPREVIGYEQRPIILQENFQSTGSRKYEYEDISAYLKKCQYGAQELSISRDGSVKVRRYVFETGRRLKKTIEDAEFALVRMKGGLESLSFEIDDEIVSKKNLSKTTLLPEFIGYGSDKSLLQVKRTFLEEFSYEQSYVSIIIIEGRPEHKAYGEMTQHDRFIRHCLSLQVEINFLTYFKNTTVKRRKLEKFAKEDENGSLSDHDLRSILTEDERRQEASDYAAGLRSGFARVSTYVMVSVKDEDLCRRVVVDIENSLNTIYSGIHYCIKTAVLRGRALKRAYKQARLKLSVGKETEMSVFRLSPFTHLPEKPILGIESEYIPEFEIPRETGEGKKSIEIGRVVHGGRMLQQLRLKVEDLRRSMTILGLIGTGKTCLTKNLLLELSQKTPEINWIVFDYKSEYTQLLTKLPTDVHKDVLVLVPSSEFAPLKINLFDPYDVSPEEHADRVFSLIREVYTSMFQQDIDLSVQMERVLKNVLDGYISDEKARVKGFKGFFRALDGYGVTHKEEFGFLEKTITALHNRLEKFMRGALKDIFNASSSNIEIEDLLKKKVIIDLGYLRSKSVPKDDVRFLMNLLVRLYGDNAIKRGLQQRLQNLIVVEECQFLVPELYRKQTSIDATPTEDLSILLRAYGVGFVFIGTRPIFAENSLANSYTIISFQLTKDAEHLQKFMNLEEKQMSYLKRMRQQEYLVFSPTLRYPTRVRVNDFEGNESSEEIIQRHNEQYNSKLYDSIQKTHEGVKSKAREIKRIFCKSCGLNGLKPECETTRTNALNLKKEHISLLQQFKKECDGLRTNPRELFEFFSSIYPENYSLRYCIFRYVFSDYAFLSEVDWDINEYVKLAKSFRQYVEVHTSTFSAVELSSKTERVKESFLQKSKDIFCSNCEFVNDPERCVTVYEKIQEILDRNIKKKRFLQRKYYDVENNITAYFQSLLKYSHITPAETLCYTKRLLFEVNQEKTLSISVSDEMILHELLKQIHFSENEVENQPEQQLVDEIHIPKDNFALNLDIVTDTAADCTLCDKKKCRHIFDIVKRVIDDLSEEDRDQLKAAYTSVKDPKDFFLRALRIKEVPNEIVNSDDYLFCYFVNIIALLTINYDERTLTRRVRDFIRLMKGE